MSDDPPDMYQRIKYNLLVSEQKEMLQRSRQILMDIAKERQTREEVEKAAAIRDARMNEADKDYQEAIKAQEIMDGLSDAEETKAPETPEDA